MLQDSGVRAFVSGLAVASSEVMIGSSLNNADTKVILDAYRCQKPYSGYITLISEWREEILHKPRDSVVRMFPFSVEEELRKEKARKEEEERKAKEARKEEEERKAAEEEEERRQEEEREREEGGEGGEEEERGEDQQEDSQEEEGSENRDEGDEPQPAPKPMESP